MVSLTAAERLHTGCGGRGTVGVAVCGVTDSNRLRPDDNDVDNKTWRWRLLRRCHMSDIVQNARKQGFRVSILQLGKQRFFLVDCFFPQKKST